jgi:hypothetical protein
MIELRPSFGVPFDDGTRELPGVPLVKFVIQAGRDDGHREYAERVAGSLRWRGLLSDDDKPTPAGEAAWWQLDAWLELGRDSLTSWAHDRAWVRDYAAGAGAAAFLIDVADPAHPALRDIGRAVELSPPSDQRIALAGGWNDDGLDFGALADTLDVASGFFGVFDAAFAGGGDLGAGDGGG